MVLYYTAFTCPLHGTFYGMPHVARTFHTETCMDAFLYAVFAHISLLSIFSSLNPEHAQGVLTLPRCTRPLGNHGLPASW